MAPGVEEVIAAVEISLRRKDGDRALGMPGGMVGGRAEPKRTQILPVLEEDVGSERLELYLT